ncbi:MAG: FAD binding domain-containing protein [Anaerolineales bacterium]|nr:FAD binding domain-containing protein [Anaerolineales bacterium]
MSLWEVYVQPQSLDEALQSLEQASLPVALIAGGTDLLLELRQKQHDPLKTLIDVSAIPELLRVDIGVEQIFIGAAVTHHTIIHHPGLVHHAQGLVEACGLIGGPQVRNVATLGGNVAHALPAGDGSIALVSLEAEALIASQATQRWVGIRSLFAGPGLAGFDRRHEIVIGFRFPVRRPLEGHAFSRVMRPQGVAIAILNMGVWMRLNADQTIAAVRIAAGPGGPTPFRGEKVETLMQGAVWGQALREQAIEMLLSEIKLRTSRHRATLEYRQHITAVLFEQVAALAYKRAQENSSEERMGR